MKRTPFLTFFALLCLSALNLSASKNVVLIIVDDFRPETPSYGANHVITPNLDTLASRGMVFNRAFCQAAICQPSRTSMLVGARPDVTGEHDIDSNLANRFRANMGSVSTMPEHFKNNGYYAAATGKIDHFGDAASWSTPEITHFENADNHYHEPGNNFNSGNKPAFESSNTPDSEYMDYKVASTAIDIIAARANQPSPFFLAVGFWKPHLPFSAPENYWNLYNPATLPLPSAANSIPPVNALPGAYRNGFSGELTTYPTGLPTDGADPLINRITWKGDTHIYPESYQRQLIHGYLACVSFIDAQIGRVVDRLDDPNGDGNTSDSVLNDTVIVVVGDHGFHLGEEGIWTKRTNFEMSSRVPLYIVAPGVTSGGENTDALTEMLDIFPTLNALCGLPDPVTHTLQGHDLSPTLADPNVHVKDYAAFQEEATNASFSSDQRGYSIRSDRWRYTEWRRLSDLQVVAWELYDLENDPEENLNLGDYPAYTKVLIDLEQRLGLIDGIGSNGGGGPSTLLPSSGAVSPSPDVIEDFDYGVGALTASNAGGSGFTGAWYGNRGLSFFNTGANMVAETLSAPSGYGFPVSAIAAANSNTNSNGPHRGLDVSTSIDLSQDNETRYFSFIYRHSSTQNFQVSFAESAGSIVGFQFAGGGALQSSVAYTANFKAGGVFSNGLDYLIVGKITTSSAGNDTIEITVYPSSGSVPITEPVSYQASQTFASSSTIDRVGLGQGAAVAFAAGGNIGDTTANARWDNFRMGDSWEDVVGVTLSGSGISVEPTPVYESFDYSNSVIGNHEYRGYGFRQAWFGNRGLSFTGGSGAKPTATVPSAPTGYGFVPVGNAATNAVSGDSGNSNGPHRWLRAGREIDFGTDGEYHFSFLYRDSNANFQLSFADETNSICGLQFAGGGGLQMTHVHSTFNFLPGFFTDGADYLIVGKIVTSAAGLDSISAKVYPSSGSIDLSEPTYDNSYSFTSSAVADRIGLGQGNSSGFGVSGVGGNNTGTAIWDEFRMGASYLQVTGQKAITLPSASGVAVRGSNQTSGTLTGSYLFSDPDGDGEGESCYQWMISDTEEGTYTEISDEDAISLLVEGSLSTKWLKLQVTPVADEQPAVGESVLSRAIPVGVSLATQLANAEYKLQEEGQLTIGFYGGSITDGWSASDRETKSWRALVTEWFEQTYPQSTINSLNLAISSTGSELGVFRADQDLIDNDVDLVFVEFAVNDEFAPGISDARSREAMEGIVRKLRKQLPRTDVVFVYTTTQSLATTHYASAGTPPKVVAHEAVASHYTVPTVNPGLTLYDEKTATGDPWSNYLPDGVHPSDLGYQVYADTVTEQILGWLPPVVPSGLMIQPLPALLGSNDLSNATIIEPDSPTVTPGSGWSMITQGIHQDIDKDALQTASAGTSDDVSFDFEGAELGVFFETRNGDGGELAWNLDSGSSTGSFTTNTNFASSYQMLSTSLAAGPHNLVIDPSSDGGDLIRVSGFMVWPGNPSAVESWQYENFRHLDGGIEHPDAQLSANPEGDPYTNLLDFAFGLDPFAIDGVDSLPTVTTTDVSNEDYLSIQFTRVIGSNLGISYVVNRRSDLILGSWQTGAGQVVEYSSVDNLDGTETVTFRSAHKISDQESEFLQLEINTL